MRKTVNDPDLGAIKVFKQYNAIKNCIEYEVIYFVGDEQRSHKMTVNYRDLDGMLDSEMEERYIRNRLFNEINEKEGGYFTKMREVPKDEKWIDEKAVSPSGTNVPPFENGTTEPVELIGNTSPSETELVIVSLLMRLNDIGMAILTHMDEEKANQVYEAHEKGEHFNPPVFIPEVNSD